MHPELAPLFLWLGATSFGGPAAHIARMRREFVQRRRWLSPQEFLDLLAACNLIPGPNSTEMAMHIGYKRAGLVGLIVAGVCFILPAALMVGVLAAAYVAYGGLPGFETFLYLVKPIVIAIILKAVFDLAGAVLQSRFLVVAACAAIVVNLLGVNELAAIFGVGVLSSAAQNVSQRSAVPAAIFTYFLKIGAMMYGSGYVLIALLQTNLVERLGWLTQKQLLDAVAVGQFTPGPLFTTATFIGYILFGFQGAAVATAGIFLPSFIFVAVTQPLVRRIHGLPWAKSFVGGVNAASIGIIAVVVFRLSHSAIVDFPTAGIALISALILLLANIQ